MDYEQIIVLASLFHDIGKFEQCCLNSRSEIRPGLLEELKSGILQNEGDYNRFIELVKNPSSSDILNKACKISLGGEVSNTRNFTLSPTRTLSPVFTSIKLSSSEELGQRFYNQVPLSKLGEDHPVNGDSQETTASYNEKDFDSFSSQLKNVLSLCPDRIDFSTLVSLLLQLFEEWLWCVPTFTYNNDISLYNHLRDSTGFAHAICKAQKSKTTKLVMIVGDIPGIQKYILGINNKKPAKMLRGRSTFVQVLSKIIASIFLREFELTEASVIMNAGGKFYIVAPFVQDFEENYRNAISKTDTLLAENFYYELTFAAGFAPFDSEQLLSGKTSLGDVIGDAGANLHSGRFRMFESRFFGQFSESVFILPAEYIKPVDNSSSDESDSIKCAVTNKPIRKERVGIIKEDETSYTVDMQVKNEYDIGDILPKNALVCSVGGDNRFKIEKAEFLREDALNVLINTSIDESLNLLEKGNGSQIKNASFISIANYASYSKKSGIESVMSFEEMSETCKGAQLLTLIKGDVDNLGLIMSVGLDSGITSVSRLTTLSSHFRYFFSTYLNNFLAQNCGPEDKKAYTIYAGGDDILLVTTHSHSLDLLKQFNEAFDRFVCFNPEIHISYSLTNFKHTTPVMLTADIAGENQDRIKRAFKNTEAKSDINENTFKKSHDKSGVMIFDSALKCSILGDFIEWSDRLIGWTKISPTPPISKGAFRHIFEISSMMDEYYHKKNVTALMWHPLLTYYVKRNLNPAYEFEDSSEQQQYERLLTAILKLEKEDEFDLKTILRPLMNSVILKTRLMEPE